MAAACRQPEPAGRATGVQQAMLTEVLHPARGADEVVFDLDVVAEQSP